MSLSPCSRSSQGYSLAELTIVLLIIGLVAAMTISTGKVQMAAAEFQGTKENLETIRAALQLFQKKHGRYPCPALPGDGPANGSYGMEVASCDAACPAGLVCGNNAVIGFVPYETLRVNEELAYDSWGGKVTYAVDKNHTVTSDYASGSIPIVDVNGNEITASPTLGDAIYVLISHGEDGKGSYNKSGAVPNACGIGKDAENCDPDDTFMDSRFNKGDIAANYFDDVTVWHTQENAKPSTAPSTYIWPLISGWGQTCAGKADGTVWCWGGGAWGQLGNGVLADSSTPVQVTGITAGTAIQGSYADAGGCYVKPDATVWCWGLNNSTHVSAVGRVGDGTMVDRLTPVQVAGINNAVQVSTGESNSCAIKADGALWCWGDNTHGEVGDGTYTTRLVPVQVATLGNNVASVWLGDYTSCAVKTDGTAWCWGANDWGQLGDGTTTYRPTPVQVSGLTNVAAIRMDQAHACAIKTDATLWCWGRNGQGGVGDGTFIDRYTPVQVLTSVKGVAADFWNTCAVKTDGTVWCWGDGTGGGMGDGTANSYNTPHQIPGFNGAEEISTMGAAGCARKTDKTIWCWGSNFAGQVGDGTTTNRLSPVQALNFP